MARHWRLKWIDTHSRNKRMPIHCSHHSDGWIAMIIIAQVVHNKCHQIIKVNDEFHFTWNWNQLHSNSLNKCMSLEMYVHLKLQFDLGISVWNARISIRIFAFNKSKIDEKVVTNFVILFFWCGMWRCLEFRLCHIYLKNNRTASIDKKGEEKNEMRPVWVCVRNIFKDKCWKLNR